MFTALLKYMQKTKKWKGTWKGKQLHKVREKANTFSFNILKNVLPNNNINNLPLKVPVNYTKFLHSDKIDLIGAIFSWYVL